jgi:hypothetical protein
LFRARIWRGSVAGSGTMLYRLSYRGFCTDRRNSHEWVAQEARSNNLVRIRLETEGNQQYQTWPAASPSRHILIKQVGVAVQLCVCIRQDLGSNLGWNIDSFDWVLLWFTSVFHSSMALQPFVGPWPLLQFPNLFFTDGRTPLTSDQPVARPLPTHRTTQTQKKRTHRHPCLEWDSNPRPQRSSERRQFMPYTARPPWSVDLSRYTQANSRIIPARDHDSFLPDPF